MTNPELQAESRLYRVVDEQYHDGYIDVHGEWRFGSSKTRLLMQTYPILSVTPKGCWIHVHDRKRFVLDTSVKRFAHKTPTEAYQSFVARKQAQIRILKSRLERANTAEKQGRVAWDELLDK